MDRNPLLGELIREKLGIIKSNTQTIGKIIYNTEIESAGLLLAEDYIATIIRAVDSLNEISEYPICKTEIEREIK